MRRTDATGDFLKRTVLLLLLPFCAAAQASKPAVTWNTRFVTGDQLFPSYILATSAIPPRTSRPANYLGDPDGLIGVVILNPAGKTRVRVSVKIDRLDAAGAVEGILEAKDEKYYVFPKIVYRYDLLPKFHQLVPANVTVTLSIDGKPAGQRTGTLRVHSISDCLHGYRLPDGKIRNMPWMFAAYVNENHPAIEEILKEALDSKVINRFVAYQKGPDEVLKQVFAIWDVFQRRGFRYSTISTTVTSGTKTAVISQTVRLVDDSLRSAQANCVDGSVLFASVLRRMGIDPFIVLLPHHAFLGFYLDADHKTTRFLETTRMGSVDLNELKDDSGAGVAVSEKTKDSASYKSFVSAVNYGQMEYNKIKEKLQDPGGDANYQVIDIAKERKRGVIPITEDDSAPVASKSR